MSDYKDHGSIPSQQIKLIWFMLSSSCDLCHGRQCIHDGTRRAVFSCNILSALSNCVAGIAVHSMYDLLMRGGRPAMTNHEKKTKNTWSH